MKPEIDILIFGGQSNMQGGSEGIPTINEPVEGALEYHYLTDTLDTLCHPCSEPLGDPILLGEVVGGGNLAPDACRAYMQATGMPVVVIHAARGGTRIDEWLPGTDRYELALKKLQAGLKKAAEYGNIRHIYYLWLQGESDAIHRTTEEQYIERLTLYKNALKEAIGIEKFGIIEVGYFCCTVSWLTDRTKEDSKQCDEVIMGAQEKLPAIDEDFVLLTQICKTISLDPEYINPDAEGHYNNKGLSLIGTEAGKALATLA
ncbi:MAG: hypothetical protein IJ518_04125 [Clostridia bacterium]|nr:hypothetical protein [Clostridia bacterium]